MDLIFLSVKVIALFPNSARLGPLILAKGCIILT